jgi:DNA-binding NarL/FixJ family response regulator
MECVRILLADDRQEILDAVSQLVDGQYDIAATVNDGEQVIGAVARLDPDLLVLDISMPVLTGIEAAARLKESGCRAKVVFLTVHDDPDYVEAAFSVGACGYVLKTRLGMDLLPALREVLQDRTFVSPLNGHSSSIAR